MTRCRADILDYMGDCLAPNSCSKFSPDLGHLFIRERCYLRLIVSQVDSESVRMTMFRFLAAYRNLRFNHANELIFKDQLMSVGPYLKGIQVLLGRNASNNKTQTENKQ